MELSLLEKHSPYTWIIKPHGPMRVPGIIYADERLILEMDRKVYEQVVNVAALPGIVCASFAMPDAHWGYGFPIGGVAAFDPLQGGVVSAGGVGFDISCGVRTLTTGLHENDIEAVKYKLADILFQSIPAGVGSTGRVRLNKKEMRAMLTGGARWAISQGFGRASDLARIEECGHIPGADPDAVSDLAKKRQRDETGTLGSGNHYLEVQRVARIEDAETATAFGLEEHAIVVSVHCGSRGLGHQIGTDYLRRMVVEANRHGFSLPDRELACAPLQSETGRDYLGAMRAGTNCAFANRQIITHLTRLAFSQIFPEADLNVLYDVSHNICKEETHTVDGVRKRLFVHRKGATRAFPPGHPDVPECFRPFGQPVLIGGSMGTASYVLAGEPGGHAFSSACHGAGRAMSRHQSRKRWRGRNVANELENRGILIRSASMRGIAEEAPGAYKDVSAVVEAAHQAGLARKVVRLEPLICIKG